LLCSALLKIFPQTHVASLRILVDDPPARHPATGIRAVDPAAAIPPPNNTFRHIYVHSMYKHVTAHRFDAQGNYWD
jgi:hypothetical protein